LDPEKYVSIDIFVDRKGTWHTQGVSREPGSILSTIDVVFNGLHGAYGEDGVVQKLLDLYCVPYTGSGASASALCMNKYLTKHTLRPHRELLGLHLPRHYVLSKDYSVRSQVEDVYDKLAKPIVVKPYKGGSSVGVSIVEDKEALVTLLKTALEDTSDVLLEEYVAGKEATCGVIDGFRGREHYALLPIEIRPSEGRRFFDYEAKYKGGSEEVCPGNFTPEESERLQQIAVGVHKMLGLRHYSRSDFIIAPNGGIYFLEVNTLPGLTEASLVPKALSAVGCTFPQFVDHLIEAAVLSRKR
jgi:D-alanine-D-alanine ligase